MEILLGVIAVLLAAILLALKTGFNEVIKGLRSLDQRLADRSQGGPR